MLQVVPKTWPKSDRVLPVSVQKPNDAFLLARKRIANSAIVEVSSFLSG